LRMKWTRQRCQEACSTLATAAWGAFMAIGDHQLDAAQTAPGELAQELRPEGLGLRRPDIHAEYFPAAVAVDADRAVRAPVSPSTSSSIRRWAVKPIEKDQRDKFYHALAAEPGCQVSLELFVKYCKLHFAAVEMPRDGVIIFGDLIGKLDVPARRVLKMRRLGPVSGRRPHYAVRPGRKDLRLHRGRHRQLRPQAGAQRQRPVLRGAMICRR